MMDGPQSGKLTIEGVKLNTYEWEGDSPTIVLAHALAATTQFWLGVVDELRGEQRAVAYDARGRGDARSADYTWTGFRDELIGVVEHLASEPVIAVGHSLGALSVACAASERPDLFRAAVLEEPPAYAGEFGLRDLQPVYERGAVLAGRPVPTLIEQGVPSPMAALWNMLDPEPMRAGLDGSASAGLDFDSVLDGIRCPVLVLHGGQDVQPPAMPSALYPGEVDRMLSHLSDGRAVHVEGGGHAIHGLLPNQYLAAVHPFIEIVMTATGG